METTFPLMAQVGFLLTPSSQKPTGRVTFTLTTMSHGPSETTWVSVWLRQWSQWAQLIGFKPFKLSSTYLCWESHHAYERTVNRWKEDNETRWFLLVLSQTGKFVTRSRHTKQNTIQTSCGFASGEACLLPPQVQTFSRLLPMSLGTSWACSTPVSRERLCLRTTPSRTHWGWARMTSKAFSISMELTHVSSPPHHPHLPLRLIQKPMRSSPVWVGWCNFFFK